MSNKERETAEPKIGLALSGGGFRAAYFHLGVLAHLAEIGTLRYVKAISCVSGGAVVGTQYYLEWLSRVRSHGDRLLIPDSDEDFLDIVAKVQRDFHVAVKTNLRMRAFGKSWRNFRRVLSSTESYADILGDLYETELFSKAGNGISEQKIDLKRLCSCLPWQGENLWYSDPIEVSASDLPMLLINATSLNTGRPWVFRGDAIWEIGKWDDTNYCWDRAVSYDLSDPNSPFTNFRLGRAVAASTCVPGIFQPITIKDPLTGISTKLVDGGVFDNQGTFALRGLDLDRIFVSDASGYFVDDLDPSEGIISSLKRANEITMNRVRIEQSLYLGSSFRGLTGGEDIPERYPRYAKLCADAGEFQGTPLTKLAFLRTDLDIFSDCEAFALMLGGYLIAGEVDLWNEWGAVPRPTQHKWDFLAIKEFMNSKEKFNERLLRILNAGRMQSAMVRLLMVWRWGTISLSLTLLTATVPLIVRHWSTPFLSWNLSLTTRNFLLLLAIFAGFSFLLRSLLRWRRSFVHSMISFGLAILGAPTALFFSIVVNPLYRFAGRIINK